MLGHTDELQKLIKIAVEKAFDEGFREAARWADRGDLLCDIGSPAYNEYKQEVVEEIISGE